MQHRWTAITVGGAGLFLAIGFIGEKLGLPHAVALACYIAAYVCGGFDVAREALPAVFRGKFDTDLLMLAAAAGATALGKWPEGAFLLFLFSLGHAGEHYALDRARNAVAALGELMPRTAQRQRDGRIEQVPVTELAVDDVVVVRPGDRVPSDGVIAAGESSLDQSAITGESVPVSRKPGDEVFAGTINQENALDVRVTRLARDNTLARVMRLVAEAQEQQSPSQRFAEKFTRRFVPTVLSVTMLMIVVPPLLLHWTWADSFYRGMLLLVAASPCALAIGTPAAVLAGIAQAARHGVLVKGGVHLENLGRLRTIAFDKTGTITTGKFSVTDVVSLNGMQPDQVLETAAAVEEQSNHPLAAAIVAAAKSRNVCIPRASAVENLAGRGMRARVDDAAVTIGAWRAFAGDANAANGSPVRDRMKQLEEAGQTVVIVQKAGEFVGLIGLADQPRERVQDVMARLRDQGIARRVMLTGDNTPVARAVAAKVGIDEFHAELLPEKKLSVIRDLQNQHGPIAMVGDGVNDAPALAAATVGIAMGGAGTAVALETADVALMGDDLGKLSFAVGLSRASQRIIKQNLVIALGVIGLLVVAAFAGVIPLSVAVVFHEGSTVAVALNALRLLAWKEAR
jgi:Cd2+/Zn2+-exporting ATPase